MKIVVLGANGQLGYDILAFCQQSLHRYELIPLTRFDCDLSDIASIEYALSSIDFDGLINCAAYTNVEKAERDIDEAFRVNAYAVEKIAKVCQKKQARFVHFSTDYVFGGKSRHPYFETDSPAPLNVYGASKLKGETLATAVHDDVIILRVASLFGIKGASGKGGNFIKTILKHAAEKGNISVVNDQWMSPTWTFDVVKMLFSLLDQSALPGIYHAVNGGVATWFDLAKHVCQINQIEADIIPIPSSHFPTIATRPQYSVLNNEKLIEACGQPIQHWTHGVEGYIQQMLS